MIHDRLEAFLRRHGIGVSASGSSFQRPSGKVTYKSKGRMA